VLNHLCPYPDCASNAEGATVTGAVPPESEVAVPHLWDGVHMCCECGRVSFECVHSECHALNRPYVRFCSYCGRSQYAGATDSNLTAVRKRVEEFDRTWEFQSRNQSESAKDPEPTSAPRHSEFAAESADPKINPGSIVARLPIDDFPKSVELISWSMVDGVLLVHQGGGGIAFVHAFQDAIQTESELNFALPRNQAEKGAAIWSKAESEMLPAPETWENPQERDDIDYAFRRPYPPVATFDRQFAVFSAAYGVIVVALAELPGWSSHGRIQPHVWVKFGHRPQSDLWLAAQPFVIQPVLNDGARAAQLLGLLLAERRTTEQQNPGRVRYYWQVIDVTQEVATITTISSQATPLELEGEPCQLHRLSQTRLLLCTENGMWVANLNPNTGEIQDLIRLWSPANARDRLELDQQHLKRNNLVRQNLVVLRDNVSSQQTFLRVTVWFRLGSTNGAQRIQCLSFHCQTTAGKFTVSGVQPLDLGTVAEDNVRLLSNGLYRGGEAAYFLAGHHGELRCCPHGEQSPQTISQGFAGDVSELKGIQVFDPLVVFVIQEQRTVRSRTTRDSPMSSRWNDGPDSSGTTNPAKRSIRLRTLASPKSLGDRIVLSGLEVDPLFWLSNLFVCERDSNGFLVIRRFDLSVIDHHTGHVPQPVQAVLRQASKQATKAASKSKTEK